MAIPEPSDDPGEQRAPLAAMRRLFDELRSAGFADWDTLSMGMSADLEAAIEQGADDGARRHRAFRTEGKSRMKIAFIGGGNMAAALIAGLLRAGHRAADLAAVEIDAARCAQLRQQFGIGAVTAPGAVLQDAAALVLASSRSSCARPARRRGRISASR